MATIKASEVRLLPTHLGFARLPSATTPESALSTANKLLRQNHDAFHMYFRDVGGHNHIAHSILSVLAMGGGPAQLTRAYTDGDSYQRPLPALDLSIAESFSDPDIFHTHMFDIHQYTNFLHFFTSQIDSKGWEAVVQEYVFARTPLAETMFSQLYEGLLHPIIHLGFGIEFAQPSIIAEGLAHAASHDPGNIDTFFLRAEELANSGDIPSSPLVELYKKVRETDATRLSGRIEDGPFRLRDGPLARAMDDMVHIAAGFQIPKTEDGLRRRTAEMISCAAYSAGAAQRRGKARKVDFFIMHDVTCSIFLSVLIDQPWISLADRLRLVEWKARLDLAWYAANGAAELDIAFVEAYQPHAGYSAGMDWKALYGAVNEVHDDGHIAKFVRALRNGEEVCKPFESGDGAEDFPVKGQLWLKVAQMGFDSAKDGVDNQEKWIWGSGFDLAWAKIPDAKVEGT
ncbi:hypothetical protein HK57_00212 [Aspergillus ustus]|uniref:HypA-like protein n=1 Tax=Aspergillus ustus TaxID=40382 RepID=A0A0C1E588_ASPUT|nr:hypothetical protein HK57_00212 [Aspergillus ustus]